MSDQGDLLPDVPIDPSRIHDADLDNVPASRWAQGITHMIEVQGAEFRHMGYAPDEAFRLARAAVLALSRYFGGRQWYMPRGDALLIALRDSEIYQRARRGNIPALAGEFGLTEIHVWKICRQQRKLHLDKAQGRLFEE